jgi:vanillate/3-O-methylgallate O-demethylase
MTFSSLQQKIDLLGNPAIFLRDVPVGAYQYPVQSQFSNWRDEQRSWRETVGLLDQSLHMTDLYIEGPDTIRLLSEVGVNSFKNYGRNKGKQLICCNHDGFLIGDMVLFGLEDDKVSVVGRPPVANWIRYVAQSGTYDVTLELDQRAVTNPDRARPSATNAGPNAWELLDKLNGGNLEKPKFFQMGEITIAGHRLRALAHAFAGAGLEFWGRRNSARKSGRRSSRRPRLRSRARSAAGHTAPARPGGWIPSPLPAIFTGEAMRGYREWLPGDGFEANGSIGGSFCFGRHQRLLLTPWDVDYGRLVKFDHDFIGREALEKMVDQPHRRKVTLEWNAEDVLAVERSIPTGQEPGNTETPCAHYAAHPVTP